MKAKIVLVLLCAVSAFPVIGRAQVTITFDYSFDANNFFSGPNIGRRAYLSTAGNALQSRLADTLSAISPGGGNTWDATFLNPANGLQGNLTDFNVAANTIVIFAGGRSLPGNILGQGGPGGFSGSGSAGWISTLQTRGESGAPLTDFGPWGGSLSFNLDASWYFDNDPSTVESFAGQNDFYSVALHEVGHLLGIGTARSWTNLMSGGTFTGTKSVTLNNGNAVPLESGGGHWAEGVMSTLPGTSTLQEVAMDPSLTVGTRKYFTDLDFAGLDDIGWDIVPVPEPAACAAVTGVLLLGFAMYRRRACPRA